LRRSPHPPHQLQSSPTADSSAAAFSARVPDDALGELVAYQQSWLVMPRLHSTTLPGDARACYPLEPTKPAGSRREPAALISRPQASGRARCCMRLIVAMVAVLAVQVAQAQVTVRDPSRKVFKCILEADASMAPASRRR
jgi:hypothetical protein